MTVMVDALRMWPTKLRCFKGGSCHLTATTLDELHAFAALIGLRREWFQEHTLISHYDITPGRRVAAISAGAKVVSMRDQLLARRAALAARGGAK